MYSVGVISLQQVTIDFDSSLKDAVQSETPHTHLGVQTNGIKYANRPKCTNCP